jgi:putative nucleotidyltransferase with HDIG domain
MRRLKEIPAVRQADRAPRLATQRGADRRTSLKRIKLQILSDLERAASRPSVRDHLFQHVLKQIVEITRATAGSLFILEERTGLLTAVAAVGRGSRSLVGRQIPLGENVSGKTALSHRTVSDKDEESLCAPLSVGEKVIGLLRVTGKRNRKPFDRRDLTQVLGIADELAVDLKFQHLLLAERGRIGKLSTLVGLSRLLNSTLSEAELRERTIQAIVTLVEAEAGALLLVDVARNELYFDVATGEVGERAKAVRLWMGEGIAGWVAVRGVSVIVPDVRCDPRFSARVDERSGFQTMSILCVPVRSKGLVIGVLQAVNKRHGLGFTREDLVELEALADVVGVAIENARLYQRLKAAFHHTVEALAEAIEKRDPYTGGHIKRVYTYSLAIGRQMGLSQEDLERLKLAAMLHDVGKIGVDDRILRKGGPLTEEEFAKMKRHPEIGVEIIDRIEELHDLQAIIRAHQERMDGSGYPEGKAGAEIPLGARIIAVADTFDAITTNRPYCKARPQESALEELRRCAGKEFDPEVVGALIRACEAGQVRLFEVAR